ncbi:Eukaryotic translation initiation factor 4E-4 [Toxocara canis]|uniref:eIF-4F 25 kDa subunit n=1 Tax=Toxocara canis TaxID=6265 RepID=A0A0B2UZ07_TOXCA|nr:Eukaryotic translation initiation factor 4E-4 [Toxocara canis]
MKLELKMTEVLTAAGEGDVEPKDQRQQFVVDITDKVDFHMFKEGIKPVWEDAANRKGGKWILRLRKGLSSRIWENLLLAMIGEQFLVGEEICGAVCSIRNQEDIVSLWNRTADNLGTTNRIRDTLRRVLNLPVNAVLEYKRHDDCLK